VAGRRDGNKGREGNEERRKGGRDGRKGRQRNWAVFSKVGAYSVVC